MKNIFFIKKNYQVLCFILLFQNIYSLFKNQTIFILRLTDVVGWIIGTCLCMILNNLKNWITLKNKRFGPWLNSIAVRKVVDISSPNISTVLFFLVTYKHGRGMDTHLKFHKKNSSYIVMDHPIIHIEIYTINYLYVTSSLWISILIYDDEKYYI